MFHGSQRAPFRFSGLVAGSEGERASKSADKRQAVWRFFNFCCCADGDFLTISRQSVFDTEVHALVVARCLVGGTECSYIRGDIRKFDAIGDQVLEVLHMLG